MYIQSFHMDGFGIFSDVSVENLSPGLSIFLGENEAGKSTCLEFLRTMLIGYPDPRNKEYKRIPGPLRGGQPGGNMDLFADDRGLLRLTRRPGSNGGVLTLTDAAGSPTRACAMPCTAQALGRACVRPARRSSCWIRKPLKYLKMVAANPPSMRLCGS